MMTAPIRVLIIEDYRLVRLGIVAALKESNNLEIVADVESAEEGLALVATHHPHVVLMDIGLPGKDGITATKEIKQADPDVKVIMLTSHEEEQEVLAALTAGANAYCMKDIPTPKLIDVIGDVAAGGAWLDPKIAQVALTLFSSAPQGTAPAKGETDGQKADTLGLTAREKEVLAFLVQGKSNSEIAHELEITIHTVKVYVSNILEKLSVFDRVQAAVKAVQENLV